VIADTQVKLELQRYNSLDDILMVAEPSEDWMSSL